MKTECEFSERATGIAGRRHLRLDRLSAEGEHLSRRHAEAYDQEGAWFIRDCGSRNGTLVGGRAIQGPSQFQPGVQVVLGACSLTMALPQSAEASHSGAVVFADRPLEASGTMMLSPDDLIKAPAKPASSSATPSRVITSPSA